MRIEVFHPGRRVHPSARLAAARAATLAESHVPCPDDLRLNICTDASPVSSSGMGGVGVCYGKWLSTQTDGFTRSHSFVVPQVHDSNECELVALADAVLVAIDEVKENITTLKANKWETRVMIWSDSHNALKYLQDPKLFPRFGTGRPKDVRALIFRLVTEMNSFPIKGPVQFYWIPGLCTPMHRLADYMTKNSLVKSGKAPISRAMKMLFPKPRAGPRPVIEPAPQTPSNSKVVELDHGRVGNETQIIGKETVKHTSEKRGPGSRNDLKRRASANDDIDNGRPDKAMRRNECVVDSNSSSGSSIQMSRSARTALQSTIPQLASAQSLKDRPNPTTSSEHANNQEEVFFVSIDQIIQLSRERGSLDTIWQQANQLQADQKDMIEKAMERQLLSNQKPFDPALFFFRMRSWSEDGKMEACFPNTLSVVEDAVSKLPDPMRANMKGAVEKQHEENRIWGAHLAIMKCMKPRAKAN